MFEAKIKLELSDAFMYYESETYILSTKIEIIFNYF